MFFFLSSIRKTVLKVEKKKYLIEKRGKNMREQFRDIHQYLESVSERLSSNLNAYNLCDDEFCYYWYISDNKNPIKN